MFIYTVLSSTICKGQDTLTVKQVFDYQIGDKFYYDDKSYSFLGSEGYIRKLRRVKITDKYYSEHDDTLFYERSIDGYIHAPYDSAWHYDFFETSDIVFYTDLDSSIFYHCFIKYFSYLNDYPWDQAFYISDTLIYNSTKLCNKTINGYHFSEFSYDDIVEYGEGLGITNVSLFREECLCYDEYYTLEFFKKGSDSCGIPDDRTNTGLNDLLDIEDIEIYPNPTSSCIWISSKINLSEYKVALYSLTGRVFEIIYDRQYLDLSYLEVGIYFLIITGRDKQKVFKILKL